MGATLLISKLCPKDVETTVFAILMANTNLGGTISSYIGTDAQKWFGVEYSKKVCNNPKSSFGPITFTGLSWILIIGDIILPLLTIPLTWLLIPAVKLDSDFSSIDDSPREVELALNGGAGLPMTVDESAPPPHLDRGLTCMTERSDAEVLMETAAHLRTNTRQNDPEML